MSSHIPQPGDRYKFLDTKGIFEITTIHDQSARVVMINNGRVYQKDDILHFSIESLSSFDYLGNFNKMSNFEALYNLLNS